LTAEKNFSPIFLQPIVYKKTQLRDIFRQKIPAIGLCIPITGVDY